MDWCGQMKVISEGVAAVEVDRIVDFLSFHSPSILKNLIIFSPITSSLDLGAIDLNSFSNRDKIFIRVPCDVRIEAI